MCSPERRLRCRQQAYHLGTEPATPVRILHGRLSATPRVIEWRAAVDRGQQGAGLAYELVGGRGGSAEMRAAMPGGP